MAILCALIGVCSVQTLWPQQPESKPPDPATKPTPQVLAIPDGTKIDLRFAEPVQAARVLPGPGSTPISARRGDKVRLVSASQVKVNSMVAVAKGAVAEATVTDVGATNEIDTGLTLRLDWVEDIRGAHVPLRATKSGKQKPFYVAVMSSGGGLVAVRSGPTTKSYKPSDRLAQSLAVFFAGKMGFIRKPWIPAGTRLRAFVHGDVPLDASELEQAQARLPLANPNATLTIYRRSGHREMKIRVSCDEKELGQIGPIEYVTLELAPGKHACQIEHEPPLQLDLVGGDEYYVLVKARTWSGGWELKPVTVGEGEDAVADALPLGQN